MDVRRRQPATVEEIDAEIVRLTNQWYGELDVFDRELARIRVDELLDRRRRLTNPEPPTAA